MVDKADPRTGELTTANYGWTKPTVGASTDAWGGYINADLDGIDTTVKSVSNAIPLASSTTPAMDGTAAAGTGTTFARADHVHPIDTSRYAASNPSGYQTAAQVTASLANYLPLAGGTLTGALLGTTATFGSMALDGAVGAGRNLLGKTAGVTRWLLQPGNSTAEGGSNAGSDFGLTAFADNGSTVIGTALLITRSTMAATFGGSLSCVSAKFNGDPNFAIAGAGAENQFTLASGYFLGYNRTTNLLRWVTTGNTIQAMTIDAPGNLVISGAATKPGGGSWAAPSDARIKTVEGDYKGGLDEVIKLAPVVYRYKGNTDDPNAGLTEAAETKAVEPQRVGLIAQAVETIMPELVTQGAGFIDGVAVTDLRTLDTTPLIFALVNAVKTLAARVAELEAKGA